MPLVRPVWLTLIILSLPKPWGTDGGLYIYSDKHKPVSYALNQLVSLTIAQRQGTMAAVTFIMMIVPVTVFIITRPKSLRPWPIPHEVGGECMRKLYWFLFTLVVALGYIPLES